MTHVRVSLRPASAQEWGNTTSARPAAPPKWVRDLAASYRSNSGCETGPMHTLNWAQSGSGGRNFNPFLPSAAVCRPKAGLRRPEAQSAHRAEATWGRWVIHAGVNFIAQKIVPKMGYLNSWGAEVVLKWRSCGPGAGQSSAPEPPEGHLSTTLIPHELRYPILGTIIGTMTTPTASPVSSAPKDRIKTCCKDDMRSPFGSALLLLFISQVVLWTCV